MANLSRPTQLTIDVSPLLEDQWTGIPVFTRRLISALQRRGGLDLAFSVNLVEYPREQIAAAMALGAGAFLRDHFEARGFLDYRPIDPSAPIFYPSTKGKAGLGAREASTVHDMSTLFMPENHVEANIAHHLDHFAKEVTTNDAVFCISEATKAALLTAIPSVASKTRLIYQYVDWPENFAVMDRNLPPLRLGRYAVVVGTIEPRKNLRLLIDALHRPEVERLNMTFVAIGRKGWMVDALLDELTPQQRRKLVFSGFVSEFVKYRLIRGAEFLIFPSLYEGFGIPALEAMSLGKAVLAARSSSLPEVVESAGVYFDPLSTDEFVAALGEIADPRKLAELAPLALARNSAFGPDRMAQPVVEWAKL